MLFELSLSDTPFHYKYPPALVAPDATCAFAGEVIKTAAADDTKMAAADHPEFHQQIIIAAHAGAELQTVSAYHGPPFAMKQRGLRFTALHVIPCFGKVFPQQTGLVKILRCRAKILLDDVRVPAVIGLDHGGKKQGQIGIAGLDSIGEGRIPAGTSNHVIVHI